MSYLSPIIRAKFVQTPRERTMRIVSFKQWLRGGAVLDSVELTVIDPPIPMQQAGYVPPAFDQRLAEVDTAQWQMDGVQNTFPLLTANGVSMQPMDEQYLTIWKDGVAMRPGDDYVVSGTQVILSGAPDPGDDIWATVQSPIVPGGNYRLRFTDPPYSALGASAYIITPAATDVMVTVEGGASPMTYRARLLATADDGQIKQVDLGYEIREVA